MNATVPIDNDTVIKFHFVKAGIPLPMVPVKVNGQGPFEFVLDTGNGSDQVLLSPDLATRLGVETHEVTEKADFPIGLSKKFSMGTIDSMEIGEVRKASVAIATAPAIKELADGLKVAIDGNIGYSLLKDFTMTLDCKASTLRLSHQRVKGGTPLEIDPLIVVEVVANGKPLHFALDTGASYCCISTEVAKELRLELGAEQLVNRSADHKSYPSKLASLRVGDHELQDVGIVAADFVKDIAKATGRQVDGVLGYSFWSKFRMTIDYPGKRLLFEDGQ